MSIQIREPAVAGMFYPDDPDELGGLIRGYLSVAKQHDGYPKAIIAPHAGYIYSGPVAGQAYAQLLLEKSMIKKVVLLGPSHRVGFQGIAATTAEAYRTPFGLVKVDQDAMRRIEALPQVHLLDQAHIPEHSLEVHVPFLQSVLEDFELIPLVVGDASPREAAEVLELLWGGSETLVVISSDLSHYLQYDEAKEKDSKTSASICALDYSGIGYDDACGRNPVNGLLMLAQQKGLHCDVLDQRNSGDTAGDKSRVVGYGAYAFYE